MIPQFPQFKKLALEDKVWIERLSSKMPPYSDFNFVSLWSWNIEEETELSVLHDNLVVKLQDYVTNETFYSFFGQNEIFTTIQCLLDLCEAEGTEQILKLLPEHNFASVSLSELSALYTLVEDKKNADYILSVEKISNMVGRALHQKRKKLNRFLRNHNTTPFLSDLRDRKLQKDILDFFFFWEKQNGKQHAETQNELKAMQRLCDAAEHLAVLTVSVYFDNKICGYTIFEVLNNGYAISDFQKADIQYEGIYEFLNNALAKYLNTRECFYINIEQDLGIPGLRRAKLDYDPSFLKKYIIAPKTKSIVPEP